ncbi:nuclear transport factor 2 family protein [Saccharomonospora sp. NPDC046836]|uniref:nuclear transport factor 2 family protein n=1 Tax=Saccharomonospora sp. NPDC046836 TaxID=3156921 RepID=UPI0033C8BF09
MHDGDLAALLDERSINKVLHAYCQGVDRRDWTQVRACYHDDAVDNHGAYVGGPDGLVDWLTRRHEHVLSSSHLLTNVSIRFNADRTLARSESYYLSLQVVDAPDGDPFAGHQGCPVFVRVLGRYVDTHERRESAGWRIKVRTCINDLMTRGATDDFVPFAPTWPTPRRDRTDMLYDPWPEA